MKTIAGVALGIALMLAGTGAALADRVEMKGVGASSFDAKQDPRAANAEAKATSEAKQAAWRAYVAAQSPARQQVIGAHEAQFLGSLDKFIVDATVVTSLKDADARTLKVVLRVGFNDEAVNQLVSTLSVGSGGQQGARSQDSLFSFLFMARRASSITQFEARQTAVAQVQAADSTAADGSVTATRTAQAGGNRQQKADVVSYELASSADVDTAVGESLNSSGIEYVSYDDIVANCHGVAPKAFQSEFVQGDELSPQTRAAVINAARACEVRYFATGTVDTAVGQPDPVSGNQKVVVSVRSELWDISKKLPRKVASVGPKQYSGLGSDQTVASRNALTLATRDVVRTLVDQLNAKGIR